MLLKKYGGGASTLAKRVKQPVESELGVSSASTEPTPVKARPTKGANINQPGEEGESEEELAVDDRTAMKQRTPPPTAFGLHKQEDVEDVEDVEDEEEKPIKNLGRKRKIEKTSQSVFEGEDDDDDDEEESAPLSKKKKALDVRTNVTVTMAENDDAGEQDDVYEEELQPQKKSRSLNLKATAKSNTDSEGKAEVRGVCRHCKKNVTTFDDRLKETEEPYGYLHYQCAYNFVRKTHPHIPESHIDAIMVVRKPLGKRESMEDPAPPKKFKFPGASVLLEKEKRPKKEKKVEEKSEKHPKKERIQTVRKSGWRETVFEKENEEAEEEEEDSDFETSKKKQEKEKTEKSDGKKKKKKTTSTRDEEEEDGYSKTSKQEKPEVKKPPTAYFLFVKEHRADVKAKNPELQLGDISKILAQMWAEADEDEKERFIAEAADLKFQHDKDHPKEKKVKKEKGPKPPPNAFMLWAAEKRPAIKAENEDISMGDMSKALSEGWKEVDAEVKKEYADKAAELKAEWKKQNPEFTQGKKAEKEGKEHKEGVAKKKQTEQKQTEDAKKDKDGAKKMSLGGLFSKKSKPDATQKKGDMADTGENGDGESGNDKEKDEKKTKGPKPPPSAFILFCNDKRPGIKVENPDITIPEMSKALSEAWKTVDADEKKVFSDKAEQLKQEWNLQNPEFAGGKKKTKEAKGEHKEEKADKAVGMAAQDTKEVVHKKPSLFAKKPKAAPKEDPFVEVGGGIEVTMEDVLIGDDAVAAKKEPAREEESQMPAATSPMVEKDEDKIAEKPKVLAKAKKEAKPDMEVEEEVEEEAEEPAEKPQVKVLAKTKKEAKPEMKVPEEVEEEEEEPAEKPQEKTVEKPKVLANPKKEAKLEMEVPEEVEEEAEEPAEKPHDALAAALLLLAEEAEEEEE